MQFLKKIIFSLLFTASIILINGCDSPESCDTSLTCSNFGTTINTCCSNTQCSYTTNGQTFNCNGTDCSTVGAPQVVSYCEASDINDMTYKLILEKTKNIKLTYEFDGVYREILK